MNFKVGEKVWHKLYKKYMFITLNTRHGILRVKFKKEIDGIDEKVKDYELHQTAQSMFEDMLFDKEETEHNIIYRDREYKIDIDFNGYYINTLKENTDIFISLELHQAIHQQLIEFGWLE